MSSGFSEFSLGAGKIAEEGIKVDILMRLPVKCLIRFKCVCKSWCSLISDPRFARAHLTRSMLENPNSSQRLLLGVGRRGFVLKSLDYERSNFEAFDAANDLLDCPVKCNFPNTTTGCFIAGSCIGLVCLNISDGTFNYRTVVVWNPTTGEFIHLPPLTQSDFTILGFGYDPASDDYKMVAGVNWKVKEVSILALKDKSWRSLTLCREYIVYRHGVYLNGCLHWLLSEQLGGSACSILSFDLSEEKFLEVIPLPDVDDMFYNKLVVLRGCLFLYYDECDGGVSKCWIMGEYGLKSSWTEFCDLTCYEARRLDRRLLCLRTDGKVLLYVSGLRDYRCHEFLCLSSPEDNSSQLATLGDFVMCNAQVYVESLVSPLPN